MSYNGVLVTAWVKIEGGCDIEYRLSGSDEVEFSLGGYANGFEFVATRRGLEQLVTAGTEALDELRSAAPE